MSSDTTRIVEAIEGLLQTRRPGATICPSDVARSLAGDDGQWRALMPHIRELAASMARESRLRVTRKGVVVDAQSPGGPIRLGSPTGPSSDDR